MVVCNLKSVKQLLAFQNYSQVMNTVGSLYSPVVNTPGSFDSPVVNTLANLDSPVMNTPGNQLLGVLWTSIRTGLQKNFLVTNRPASQDFPVSLTQGSLDYLVSVAPAGFCKPIWVASPVGEYTGELIRTSNNSSSTQKCLMRLGKVVSWKNQSKKISWHCTFKKTVSQRYYLRRIFHIKIMKILNWNSHFYKKQGLKGSQNWFL